MSTLKVGEIKHENFTGTTQLKLDNSGRVLIGTTTEGHDNADDLTIATSGQTGITIRSASNQAGNIYFSDATSGAGESDGYISYTQSTNKMLFGVNQDLRMTIDSAGKVSIGSETPIYNFNVRGSGQQTILVGSTNAGGAYVTFDGDSNGDGQSGDYCHIGHNTNGDMELSADNPNGDADIIISAGNAAEKLRVLSSSGITFNGDTAAANALDDYEEGTWTPNISTQYGSWTSIAYSEQHGFYVKIGRQVTVWVRLRVSSINASGASGYLYLNGLPYRVATSSQPNTASDGGTLSVNYYSNLQNLSNKIPTGYSWANTNSILMMLSGQAGSSSVAPADMFNASNAQIYGCMTYFIG